MHTLRFHLGSHFCTPRTQSLGSVLLGRHHVKPAANIGLVSSHVFRSETTPATQQSASQQQAQPPRTVQPVNNQQQASQPERPASPQQGTYAVSHDLSDDCVKIIGLGQRGISAASRLLGNKSVSGAEFWVLDTDAKVLSNCGVGNTIQISSEDAQDAQLSAADLRRLAGEGAITAATEIPRQRPGSPVPTTGVAFLLAGAGGIPGGPTLMLQIAAYLRRTGFFVVAALTRPFDFEGRRKLEEADALIEALQDVAQLVVVVPQGVLTRASADLTINEASAIADNTLEVSCRAVLWAVGAPEVLLASGGAMLWHGRDLRQYKRLLSPPVEVLLTCPGVGGLGRGLASIPVTSLVEAGLASGLSTLAEDAVAAAVESPFLENTMPNASGVLCVLSLPASVLSHDFNMAPGALNDPEKYAIRAAVQVAAMTVIELAGQQCREVVVCAHVRPDWPHTDPALLCLEATLLVLEDPAAAEKAASAAATVAGSPSRQQSYPYMTPPAPAQRAAVHSHSPAQAASTFFSAAQMQRQQGHQQQQRSILSNPGATPRPPSSAPAAASSTRSAWSAMSAIAGGSAAAAVGQYKRPEASTPRQVPAASPHGEASGASRHSSSSGTRGAPAAAGAVSNDSGAGRSSVNFFGSAAVPAGATAVGAAAARPSQQQPVSGDVLAYVPRMADKHVDTMVAQSLDLPPSAARWRHQQRRQQPKRVSSHFPLVPIPWNTNDSSGNSSSLIAVDASGVDELPATVVEGFVGGSLDVSDEDEGSRVDVRSRVAGMLQKERQGIDHGWLE